MSIPSPTAVNFNAVRQSLPEGFNSAALTQLRNLRSRGTVAGPGMLHNRTGSLIDPSQIDTAPLKKANIDLPL